MEARSIETVIKGKEDFEGLKDKAHLLLEKFSTLIDRGISSFAELKNEVGALTKEMEQGYTAGVAP